MFNFISVDTYLSHKVCVIDDGDGILDQLPELWPDEACHALFLVQEEVEVIECRLLGLNLVLKDEASLQGGDELNIVPDATKGRLVGLLDTHDNEFIALTQGFSDTGDPPPLCRHEDPESVLDRKVGGKLLVDPLGRLKDSVKVGTVLGCEEGVDHFQGDHVRNEIEDIRGISIRVARHGVLL